MPGRGVGPAVPPRLPRLASRPLPAAITASRDHGRDPPAPTAAAGRRRRFGQGLGEDVRGGLRRRAPTVPARSAARRSRRPRSRRRLLTGMLHRPPRARAEGVPVAQPRTAEQAPDVRCGARSRPLCYPSPTMAADASSRRRRSTDSARPPARGAGRACRRSSTTIEEGTFATTQSDMSGDVGLDDESADAGTATFEREKDLSIENNVRDLLDKIERALKRIDDGHVRGLRALRQAHREGTHQGPAVRRPLHQGRAGAVAPLAPWTRVRAARRHPPVSPRRVAYLLDRVTKLWAERTPPGRARRPDPRRAHAAVHDELGRRVQHCSPSAPWFFARRTIIVWCSSSPPRSATGPCCAVALGLVLGGALGNLTDRARAGPGCTVRVVDFIDSARLARLQPRGLARSSWARCCWRSPRCARTTRRGRADAEPSVAAGPGRLDAVLARLTGLPRADIQRAIAAGRVTVDGEPRRNRSAWPGARRSWSMSRTTPSSSPRARPVPVRYRDEHLLVVAKPRGPGRAPDRAPAQGTLVNRLLGMGEPLSTTGGPLRPGIVHRLDAGTWGR